MTGKQQFREFYELVRVNQFGEEIDYINREFKTEEEAWSYLKNVEHIKSRKGWEVRWCKAIPATIGTKF